MEKPASTDYAVQDFIRRRWSPRAFAVTSIDPDILKSILEAARWAASSYNEQPWYYLLADKKKAPDEFNQMLSCLEPINAEWAQGAAILMISIMKKSFTKTGKPNRVAMHDVGAASCSLTLEALTHGVFVHQMGGILIDKIRETYHIPTDYEPVAALALGYAGHLDQLPEKFKSSEKDPRTRKRLPQFVFSKIWGNALSI